MSAKHWVVELENAEQAYEIVPASGGNGNDITIQNNNVSATILIGGSDVTVDDYGFKLTAGSAISFELDGTDALWATSPTSAAKVNVLSIDLEGSYRV